MNSSIFYSFYTMKKVTTLAVLCSTLLFVSCTPMPETRPEIPSPEPVKVMELATIEWGLGFPSEWIPPTMEVCAKNTATQEITCTNTHIKDAKYYNQTGYMIKVPAGTYTVIANIPGNTSFYGLYSEFVPCGLRIECPSHELIPVTVTAGQTVSDINPVDWYSN